MNSANAGLAGVGSLAALGGWGPIRNGEALVGRGRNAAGLPFGGEISAYDFSVTGMAWTMGS